MTTALEAHRRAVRYAIGGEPLQIMGLMLSELQTSSAINAVLEDLERRGHVELAEQLAIVFATRRGAVGTSMRLLQQAPAERFTAVIDLPHPDRSVAIGTLARSVMVERPEIAQLIFRHPAFNSASVLCLLRGTWAIQAPQVAQQMQALLHDRVDPNQIAHACTEADASGHPTKLISIAMQMGNPALDQALCTAINQQLNDPYDVADPVQMRACLDLLEARRHLRQTLPTAPLMMAP